ncbi:MAG: hypothetical protein ACOX63_08140 [Christensenellales bacterium]
MSAKVIRMALVVQRGSEVNVKPTQIVIAYFIFVKLRLTHSVLRFVVLDIMPYPSADGLEQ